MIGERTGWDRDAACVGVDPEVFAPTSYGDVEAAKRYCRKCKVRRMCLITATAQDRFHTVRGGETPGLFEQRHEAAERRHAALFAVPDNQLTLSFGGNQ